MTTPDPDAPPLDEFADAEDALGWSRAEHGTFAEHAAPDDAVPTMGADDYLTAVEARPEGGGA